MDRPGAPAGPAVFLRPVRRRPALLVEDALPGDDVVLDVADAFGRLPADALGQVLLEEGAAFLAERVFVRRKTKVHDALPALVNLEQSRRAHAAADAHRDDT